MKMFCKFIAIALILLSIFTIVAPITVNAENVTTIIFKAEVDPRIRAKGQAILIGFNDENGEEYNIYLRKESGYEHRMELPQGYYTIFSGMVMGDLAFEYDVIFDDFSAYGLTQEVIITAGDVNYSGEVVEDTNNLPGDIDRDKTNELLEADGLPTIDWEKLDAAHDPNAPWDPDNKYMGHAEKPEEARPGEPWHPDWGEMPDDWEGGIYQPPEDPEDPNGTQKPGETTKPDDDENGDIGNVDNPQNPGGNTGDETQQGSKGFSILFVIIIVVLCAIPVVIRISGHGESDDE